MVNSACIEPPPSPRSHAPREPSLYSLATPQVPSASKQGDPDGTTPYRLYNLPLMRSRLQLVALMRSRIKTCRDSRDPKPTYSIKLARRP